MNKQEAAGVVKKVRVDGQKTGLAGEFFVAAELLKRDLQVSITFGNAKQIDLFARHPEGKQTFTVQVKALRSKNFFPIGSKDINADHIYVFVILNKPGKPVEYFIVRGQQLLDEREGYRYLSDPKFPGISPGELTQFVDAWSTFGCN
jgi:hypothetical protein